MSAYSLEYLATHTVVGDVTVNGLPWTARCLGIANDPDVYTAHTVDDGSQWLYPAAVPLNVARDLLDAYAVDAHPLSFIRPTMPWDDQDNVVMIDGQSFTVVSDPTRQVIVDRKSDIVHFVPKEGYQVHPFTETLLDRTGRIVGESNGDLHIDSVGVLADGGEAWVSIATGSLLTLPEGVDYYPHILAAGSHNGTLSSTFGAVVTMTVCDNTREMAFGEMARNGTRSKIKHTRMSADRLAKAESESRTALGLLENAADNFAASVKALCEQSVTDSQWSAFVTELAPIDDEMTKNAVTRAENARSLWTGLYKSDPRVTPWTGTAFGALQAVNTADLWERGTRNGTDQYTRTIREAITGKLSDRESERADVLAKVLAIA